MKFVCKIGWHNWSHWKEHKIVKPFMTKENKIIKNEYDGQRRYCLHCNLIEVRAIVDNT